MECRFAVSGGAQWAVVGVKSKIDLGYEELLYRPSLRNGSELAG